MIEVNKEDRGFAPTVEWMQRKYNELNEILFKGELGECDFKIFTTGKGSQGNTLGWFGMQVPVKVRRGNRRMFVETSWPYYDEILINSENFVDICKPQIELNGNYTGTEYGFLATLVHEMCHYYTYMRGWAPKQHHGREFHNIGELVSYRSNNLFTIDTLATAEDLRHLDLSDEMKAKKTKRTENKKNKIMGVFSFYRSGNVRLTTTSSQTVISDICNFNGRPSVKEVVITNDIDIIELLFKMGYNVNMRTWRYWDIAHETKILSLLKNTDNKKVIPNPQFVAETRKRTTGDIINEVLNRFIEDKENNDCITIEPDMNLGVCSPFEI